MLWNDISWARSGCADGAAKHLSRRAVGLDRSESALRTRARRVTYRQNRSCPQRRSSSSHRFVTRLPRDPRTNTGPTKWTSNARAQTAWITLAEGKGEEALRQMRSAAEHEDRTDKHNVTPGVILPARELLGEMLLELKQPAQAMVEFEATLRTAPNRFNALSGAARAAKLSGDNEKAKTYYAKLLSICEHADGDRPELQEGRSRGRRELRN